MSCSSCKKTFLLLHFVGSYKKLARILHNTIERFLQDPTKYNKKDLSCKNVQFLQMFLQDCFYWVSYLLVFAFNLKNGKRLIFVNFDYCFQGMYEFLSAKICGGWEGCRGAWGGLWQKVKQRNIFQFLCEHDWSLLRLSHIVMVAVLDVTDNIYSSQYTHNYHHHYTSLSAY